MMFKQNLYKVRFGDLNTSPQYVTGADMTVIIAACKSTWPDQHVVEITYLGPAYEARS
jgi:hypothetical protein